MRIFTPIGLWQPEMLFAFGLMNFKIFDLKMLSISKFWVLKWNLFYSVMVDRKYGFLNIWCFTLIMGILCAFPVLYWQLDCGIISKWYFGHWLWNNLKKNHSFLHQRLCWRDPKFDSWKIFSFDVSLTSGTYNS